MKKLKITTDEHNENTSYFAGEVTNEHNWPILKFIFNKGGGMQLDYPQDGAGGTILNAEQNDQLIRHLRGMAAQYFKQACLLVG